jgi:crotonobetainyl-CoA:carnitine CoA-transferase CaiB-like acyl-CoA transferase
MAAEPTGPLKGMKIVEVAQVVAGPTCGYMLADLGAEVIKVERIPNGDDNRRMVPPAIAGEAAAFLMLNRNKRGIALDLKAPAGREVLFRLADRADAMIENYRKGVMDRLGVGYEALKRRNPGLIYCAISGFGQTGPKPEIAQ